MNPHNTLVPVVPICFLCNAVEILFSHQDTGADAGSLPRSGPAGG